jgi:AcrR family transcriptional regulator
MKDSFQEQMIAARRGQILDAATSVFAAKGFHRTTIRDIATVAGIADGTIYNYFENKTALLLGILDRLNQTERRDLDLSQALVGDFRSFMRAYLQQRLTVLGATTFEVFQVVLSEVLINKELRDVYYQQIIEPTFALAEKYLQQLVDQGVVRPVDVKLTNRAVASTVLGLIVLRIMGDEPLAAKWDDLPTFLTDLIMDGLELKQE